mmetsp:Transcript_10721/g.18182  ORF Transcript_10721/g.18182 Transcript_10721/m.18182 type:complete len:227 (+) Transcript_10721:1-681(+)
MHKKHQAFNLPAVVFPRQLRRFRLQEALQPASPLTCRKFRRVSWSRFRVSITTCTDKSEAPPPKINVVLFQPRIHWNVGNVGRTCLGFDARLHLVGPFGFGKIDNTKVRRAGLDYWDSVDLHIYDSFEEFEPVLPTLGPRFWFSKKGRPILDFTFPKSDQICLIFGSETEGLDPIQEKLEGETVLSFPINDFAIRSFNLSTSVGMAIWETHRQQQILRRLGDDVPS